MLNSVFRLAAVCVWMTSAPVAQAAEAAPDAAVPPPFQRYQGWRDEPLQDWRAANERVGEVGGWRTYLRESQEENGAAGDGQSRHSGH